MAPFFAVIDTFPAFLALHAFKRVAAVLYDILKPGDLREDVNPFTHGPQFADFLLVAAKRNHRVDPRRSTSGNIAGEQSNTGQQY
jgi:hypothetical protein